MNFLHVASETNAQKSHIGRRGGYLLRDGGSDLPGADGEKAHEISSR